MDHTTPSDEIFQEMKTAAIEIWNTYNNDFGYVTEKLDRVNSITNFQDNAMVFYRMFDGDNKRKMRYNLSKEAWEYINNNQ